MSRGGWKRDQSRDDRIARMLARKLTYSEIGAKLGISKQRVQQIAMRIRREAV